jgi:hypothetical protein
MKNIKLIVPILALIFSLGTSHSLKAQNPCNPDSTFSCDTCACQSVLPDGCTEQSRIMYTAYTVNPTCLAIVYYRLRYCDSSSECLIGRCSINIDSIVIDSAYNSCVSCEVFTQSDMQEFMSQIERLLLMHGGWYGPCGYVPDTNSTFQFNVAKPACWKRKTAGGGGLINGKWSIKFEPCNRHSCCVSGYCVYIDSNRSYYIVQYGPHLCYYPVDCEAACEGGKLLCE